MTEKIEVAPTILFDGVIRAVNEIHVSPFGGRETSIGAKACASVWTDGGRRLCIPGSTIRGALRHNMSQALILARGQRVTVRQYVDVALGGMADERNKVEQKTNVSALRRARYDNPALSVFGSMFPQIPGRLMVGHAVCQTPPNTAHHRPTMRRSPLADPKAIEYLDPADVEREIAIAESTRANVKLKKEAKALEAASRRANKALADAEMKHGLDSEHTIKARAEAEAAKAALDEEMAKMIAEADTINLQMVQSGVEYIPQGSLLPHSMRLRQTRAEELACVLIGIDGWAKDPTCGGKLAVTLGQVDPEWQVRTREAGTLGVVAFEQWVGIKVSDARGMLADAVSLMEDHRFRLAVATSAFGKSA